MNAVASAPSSANASHWRGAALVVASGVVAALQVGKVSIGLPALQADLGLGLAGAGWVMGLFALLGLMGGAAVGALVSRLGERRLLIAGLLSLAVGSAAGSLAPSLGVLLGARVVEGAGFLFILVAAPAVLQRVVRPPDRNLAFGIWGAFMPAGIALALLAGPMLAGWRVFWMANAALAAATAALVWCAVPRDPAPAARVAGGTLLEALRRTLAAPGLLLMTAAFAAYALQYFAVISFLPTLLVERMQVSVAVAGALSALAVGANVLGNVAAGVLLSRGVSTGTLVLAASLVTGSAGVGLFLPGLPNALVFGLCVLFSAVGGLLPASVIAAAMQGVPQPLAPVALGFTVQGNNLGQLIGPAAVGAAVGMAGWTAAGMIVGATAVVGALCGLGLRRLDRSPR